MKTKLFTSVCCVICALGIQAQVSKTVDNLSTGNLTNLLTDTEKKTVTDLTLIGKMNDLDFKTMREEMPNLSNVDLSGAQIIYV